MNINSILGLLLIIGVVYFGAIRQLPSQEAVFNWPSIILVVGGTIAALFISFPMRSLIRIRNLVRQRFLKSSENQKSQMVREIVFASQTNMWRPQDLQSLEVSHSFLKEGILLALDTSLSVDDFEYVLRKRAEGFKREQLKDAKFLIALAKFPPAFGLLGSITGIIAMLMNLGHAGKEVIGQGMALALLTTFWGVAVTNMFILPLADFTQRCNQEDEELRSLIVEGLLLIKAKEDSAVVARKMRSLLPLEERQGLAGLQRVVNIAKEG